MLQSRRRTVRLLVGKGPFLTEFLYVVFSNCQEYVTDGLRTKRSLVALPPLTSIRIVSYAPAKLLPNFSDSHWLHSIRLCPTRCCTWKRQRHARSGCNFDCDGATSKRHTASILGGCGLRSAIWCDHDPDLRRAWRGSTRVAFRSSCQCGASSKSARQYIRRRFRKPGLRGQ